MAFSKIMISAVPLSVLLIALAAQVHGATRNSTSYSILTDTADGGGRRATSSTYTVDGSVGSVLGISTIATPLETVRNGYIGQIFDLTGLVVNAVSPSAVAAWQVLDDASLFAISATNNGFRATGLTLGTIALGFAPTEGQVLMLVNNTSASAILGTFSSLPQGSIITASYGGINYSFAISYTGGTGNDIILTGLAPQAVAAYRDWARLRFGQQNISDPGLAAVLWGPKVDTDHDGRDNLTEFAMGSDPLVPDFTPITQIEVRAEGGGNRLYLWFNRRVASPDVDYIPGVSSDLTNWFTDAAHVEFVAALALGNGYEEAEYRDLTMLTSEGGRFCRLLLSYRNVSLPQIALTGPAANSYFVTGDSLSLAANVADTGGGIMAVEFYADGVLIGRGSGAPFSLTWTPPGTAPVSITVRAIDYMGRRRH